MKESIYKSYDELPIMLNAETLAKVLGIAPSSAYELMHRSVNRCYLIPSLGDKQLLQLNTETIQKIYNEMQSVKSLSNETVRGAHMVLHEALEAAVHEHLIPRNPTNGTTLPRKEYAQKHILNNEQLDRFLQVIKTEPAWYDFFYTEITTGLRRGEICGLRWEDLDSVTGQLSIRRSVHPGKDGPEIGETKTDQGKRNILLPASTLNLLRKRKTNSNSPWIFQDPKDPAKPVSPNAAYQKLKALLKKAELPSIRFHDLRHTFATSALEHGMDVKTLSAIIGHVNSATTLNVYSHVTDQMRKQAAEKIDAGIGACEAPEGDLPRVPSEDEVPADKAFEPFKGTRRKPGTGCLHQINDHLWEGKYAPRGPDGKRIHKNVYAPTKEECEEKL